MAPLAWLALAQPASGQNPDVTIDVGECVNLDSPEARLACYESKAQSAIQERGSGQGATETDSDDAETGGRVAEQERRADKSDRRAARRSRRAAEAQTPPIANDGGQATGRAASTDQGTVRQSDGQAGGRSEEASDTVEIFATVTALRETVPNTYVITLDNGQVWRQMRPKRYYIRTGQSVRLYSTHWGPSFRLTAEGVGGYIQVERVR